MDKEARPSSPPPLGLNQGLDSVASMKRRLFNLFLNVENSTVRGLLLEEAIHYLKELLKTLVSSTPQSVLDPGNTISNYPEPFLVSRPDGTYALPFPDDLASERTFERELTILPSGMANLPCHLLSRSELLRALNAIFGRKFRLSAEIEACLQEFIDDECDLGLVYGYLRPLIKPGTKFPAFRSKWREQSTRDFELRGKAIDSNHIVNPKVPPRRVWDLFANRVVPFHILPERRDKDGQYLMPENLWPVSHSWVAPGERHNVLTAINGKAWRVPIPTNTTLEHIRNELLILGAEYVWLDVLCLRQQDEHLPERESVRKREWRLDIPTIGYIYNENRHRPTIVYFNGLGLPFLDHPAGPDDRYHWLTRTWTLQECPDVIIPAGLEHKIGRIQRFTLGMGQDETWCSYHEWASPEFLADFRSHCSHGDASFSTVYDHLGQLQSRFCANPVDRVACLAYLLHCPTLPIYDADMDVEVAWSLLIECMNDYQRTQLLFLDFPSNTTPSSWRPTWAQVTAAAWSKPRISYSVFLRFGGADMVKRLHASSSSLGYKYGLDVYYHQAYVIADVRLALDVADTTSNDVAKSTIKVIPFNSENTSSELIATGYGVDFSGEPKPYWLITVLGAQRWLIARPMGIRRIDTQIAVEVTKISILHIPDFSPSVFDSESTPQGFQCKTRLVAYC